ncbi:Bacterial mobilisation domain-containing protein, partial [Dysosmobacter welbionis]
MIVRLNMGLNIQFCSQAAVRQFLNHLGNILINRHGLSSFHHPLKRSALTVHTRDNHFPGQPFLLEDRDNTRSNAIIHTHKNVNVIVRQCQSGLCVLHRLFRFPVLAILLQ